LIPLLPSKHQQYTYIQLPVTYSVAVLL
jgi:hypothetical protein